MFSTSFNRQFRSLSISRQGWLICTAVMLLSIVRSSVNFSFGLFVAKLETGNNQTSMAVQNWIGTLSFTLTFGLSPLSVLFIRTLGQHGYQIAGVAGVIILSVSCFLSSAVALVNELWMFLTHSLLYGVGSSLCYMSSSLVIGEYFDKNHKHHVLATGILQCGYPVGSLLFNPINGWLLESYGVPTAFRVSGCLIFIVGLPCCLPLLSKLDADANEPIDYGDYKKRMNACCNPKQFAKRPEIFLWLLGNMMSFCGYYMPFVHLAYFMNLANLNPSLSKWAMGILSLVECIVYGIASGIGDYLKGKLIVANIIAAVGLSTIYFAWPFLDNSVAVIMSLSCLIGCFLGLAIAYQYSCSGEVTQLPNDVAWAATNLWSGIGFFLGPLFSGAIFDIRHSYNDVWFVCGGLYLAQTLVFAAIPIIGRCRVQTTSSNDYTEIIGDTKEGVTDDQNIDAAKSVKDEEGLAIDNPAAECDVE